MNPIKSIMRRSVRELARHDMLSQEKASKLLHLIALGRFPDMKNPRDLNEKIMWMMFNTDTTRWSELADKIGVREYLKARGFGNILLRQPAIFERPDDITFDCLPESFVIKTSNGNAQTLIIRHKSSADIQEVRRTVSGWFNSKSWKAGAEPHYGRIKPRILIEELLPGTENSMPLDFKFMCFNGKPTHCLVCTDRESTHFHCKLQLFKLPDWEPESDLLTEPWRSAKNISRPEHLEEMMKYAEMLSKGFKFVRVDLYDTPMGVYFGELTFTPAAARIDYFTNKALLDFGSMIELDK